MGMLLLGAPLAVGKAQVNTWFPFASDLDYPFIDHFSMNDRFWLLDTGVSGPDQYSPINSSGFPSNVPVTADHWFNSIKTYYLSDATVYVLLFDPKANLSLSADIPSGWTLTRTLNNPGRMEFQVTSTGITSGSFIYITVNMDTITSGGMTFMKWFLKSEESDLNAGKITSQKFRAEYSRFGCWRSMDWATTNNNSQRSFGNRVLTSQQSRVGVNVVNYCGIATLSGNDYTCPSAPPGNPSSYADGQQIQFTTGSNVAYKAVTGFTNASPPVVTCVGFGGATGEKWIFPEQTFNNSIDFFVSGRIFTITRVDADHFSLDGYDSTTWGTYTGANSPTCTKQIRVSAGLLPPKPVFSITGGSMYQLFDTDFWNTSTFGHQPNLINLIYNSDLDGWVKTWAREGDYRSMGVEILMHVANELNVSPHICLGHMVNDDCVTQTATYIRDNLNAGLVCSIEYSNEVWNPAFSQTSFANYMSRNKWGKSNNNYSFWYGYRFSQVMTLVSSVFAGQMGRVDRAMAVWTAAWGAGGQDDRFQAPGTGLSAYPATLMDSIHIAPYYEADRSKISDAQSIWGYNYGNSTQKQAAIVWLDNFMRDDGNTSGFAWYTVKNLHDSIFPAWKAIANAPAPGVGAVKLRQYEGGMGQIGGQPIWNRDTGTQTNVYNPGTGNVTLTDNDRDNFFNGYLQSPEAAATLQQNWTNFLAAGGERPSQYVMVSQWGAGAEWGVIRGSIFGTKTALYTQLVSFNGRG